MTLKVHHLASAWTLHCPMLSTHGREGGVVLRAPLRGRIQARGTAPVFPHPNLPHQGGGGGIASCNGWRCHIGG
jgi:hypothetical protein